MKSAPRATYRLQLGPDLDLAAAAEPVGYLADLGISHVYCSPFLQAAPDATHGYAVVDPQRVDDRLGGEEGRRRLVSALARHGLGMVVDLVPNHMAVSLPANRWFWEVLEHGPSSRYAGHFDVDWDPSEAATRNKVLLPILEDHYGREVEGGTIRFEHDGGHFLVFYRDNQFPASPRSVADLVAAAAERAGSDELAFVSRALALLPPAASTNEVSRRRRHADWGVLVAMLEKLTARPDLAEAIDATVDAANHDADVLDGLLDLQNYRLARWRVAEQEVGYRRFFDINALIGLRVEDPDVFVDSHALVLAWVEAGEVDGLRVDHPDGLRRPAEYLHRLREAAPEAWIVVEKVLEGDEELPPQWPVDGTTGYDFLTDVTALLVDPAGEEAMTRLWNEVSGSEATWEEVADRAKRDVRHEVLAADVNRLTDLFLDLVQRRRRFRDFTRSEIDDSLTEALVSFDVYRTYVTEEGTAGTVDRDRIDSALDRARDHSPDLDPELFELLGRILTADMDGPLEAELRMRFQQLTGPMMAKGVEDTAFYRYLRLTALCDVGGNPGRFGLADAGEFHRRCLRAQERWPEAMLALSTHDTKRSEDVRARLAVLSEIPQEWAEAVGRWRGRNSRHRSDEVDGATEYLIYQTLVGAHPITVDRLLPYLEKATKEAKVHTSWTDPDSDYDGAVADFARRLAGDDDFGADLDRFVEPVVAAGRINSLSQKTIQLTGPGVPDIYQGTEIWDLSLVDPDNRRPVDHQRIGLLLGELDDADLDPALVMSRIDDGLPKLWVVHALLALRSRRPDAFGPQGAYRPLMPAGPAADHAFSFTRGDRVAVLVPRLTLRLEQKGGWDSTSVTLPSGRWTDVFTDRQHEGEVEVATLLADFPVAVLERS